MAKREINITLYISELIFDVQNKTYITGRSRNDGTNHEKVANMQANDDDENLNQVLRSIGNAFSTLKTKLGEYIESSEVSGNNVLLSPSTKTKVITLHVPSNFNNASVDTISSQMHQYIVNVAIADWFNMTSKDDAKSYDDMSISNLGLIREAINRRVRPKRTSAESESRFDGVVDTPTITYNQGVVTITCATEGATIRYTTDGVTPDRDSDVYSEPISVDSESSSVMFKAFAHKDGMYDSGVSVMNVSI